MYGRPDENWIVACGCLSGYNKLEINRYWDWHQDLEAYGKYLRLSPVSANLNVSKRKQSPFKLISCCCKQVAIKVESLSGFTNSLLRPHVFPQVVCLLHCYLVSLHFTLLVCLFKSEVLSIEIVDYLEWSSWEVYGSISRISTITCWHNLAQSYDAVLERSCSSSCWWLGRLRWNRSPWWLYQGIFRCLLQSMWARLSILVHMIMIWHCF